MTTAVPDADPRVSGIVGHCFNTLVETMFVSRYCQALGEYCDTAIDLSPYYKNAVEATHPVEANFPPTLKAYRDNQQFWIDRMRVDLARSQPGLMRDRVVIYGGLPVGTRIKIAQVRKWWDGEDGTYWIAVGTIESGEYQRRRLLLPTDWLRADALSQGARRYMVKPEPEVLKKCDRGAMSGKVRTHLY